jgi:hypothetical protein
MNSKFLQELANEKFFIDISADEKRNIKKALSFILPLFIFITLWDSFVLKNPMTPMYAIIKGGVFFNIGSIIFVKKFSEKMSLSLFLSITWMFIYSFYGVVFTHFTYCYSFLEMYFVISFFFRFSKKSYIALMTIGGALNIAGVYFAMEPEFIKAGMSIKPHVAIISAIIYFLSYVLFFNVTKRREELFNLQEKFAIIGKQSSYIFHEIKKPMNRLLKDEIQINDILQINDIMLNIDLTSLNLRDIFEKLEIEFEGYFKEYKITFIYPRNEYLVLANHRLMYQVFKNLTVNAIEGIIKNQEYIEQKIITISYVEDLDNSKKRPKIHFHNTGSLIHASQRESIFNPFYSTKGTGNNHGLGLSFCRNIFEGHKGEIFLSPEKSGPLFVLIL